MKGIEQIYTNCLAQGAYFIESDGEAVVIDPLRETDPYVKRAVAAGVKIKYIFETHFHADFVSGHLDLAKETGATIVFGPGAKTSYDIHEAKDGEEFKVGQLTFKVLHTPGHTPESTCYLLLDENGKEKAIFTGDTLFIGDVGRPDLAQKAAGLTQEELAGWLYDSLREKIMPLPDDVIVYPAHGAGSACGKNMSSETWDTLGNQKKTNYALRANMSRKEFINELTLGLSAPPQYFSENVRLNKVGYESYDEVMERGNHPISVQEFEELVLNPEVLILDVRDKKNFIDGFIPGSLFIGLNGNFAPWVGALIADLDQKIALIVPEGRESEAVMRLSRVGYDHCIGYLEGGLKAWRNAGFDVAQIETVKVEHFIDEYTANKIPIIDVRKPSEFETTHIIGAKSLPLDEFANGIANDLENNTFYLHCRSGYRSTIAASLLHQMGLHKFINVHGSFDTVKERMKEIEGTCPSLAAV
jgi:glyoxylase-like metal-dependent hydrolase (beta-lactamase superfamily II)/rhodanese-related sulfurtransferase